MFGDRGVTPTQRTAEVAGDAGAAMEQLDGLLGDPCFDRLAHQPEGHGIPVSMQLDVVVDACATAAPLGIDVRLGRQRQQSAALGRLEQRTATGAQMAHRTGVELLDQFADRAVQFGQREEPPMP